MKDKFAWLVGEDEYEETVPVRAESARWLTGSLWFLIVAITLTGALLGSWQAGRNRIERSENEVKTAVQSILDLEHGAFLRGDGDLYFSLYSRDSAWIPAQLLPVNRSAARAGFQVTRAEPRDDFIWANLSWTADDQTYQRIAFFQWQGDRLVHTPTAPGYWGNWTSAKQEWGDLIYTEIDEVWAAAVAIFVEDQVAAICPRGCQDDRLPLTLHLSNDFSETAVPGQIRVPSPRLIALDENGQPAPLFWQMLRQRLETALAPAVIRFAVPPPSFYNDQNIMDFDQAAARFMADHPDITIEIVKLAELPDDWTTLATEFDGAAVTPTEAMLAAGLVRDLTDYVDTDPDFDAVDFFPQIWRGTEWYGRTWMLPLAANMRLLYYDKGAYQRANLPEPSLRWTWEEMAQNMDALVPGQLESSELTWRFLDTGLDSLYSYAYNLNNPCLEATVLCQSQLQAQNVAAALAWYRDMADQPGQMPDLSGQLADLLEAAHISSLAGQMEINQRQQFLLWNFQTSRRKAIIWVDLPVDYERQLLMANLGAVPFPGSDRFDGITPLWVYGSFISQGSERPLAVWQWLKFLSYQRPTPRMIPARPSVANGMGYWAYLPRPLGDAMRTAFPFARPVLIEEQMAITWEQVTAVLSGQSTPLEAAQKQPVIRWFVGGHSFSQ